MFKTRTIKVSIYSLGWERFIPNEGIFHSQRGNKRRLIFSTCALIIHTFLLSLQKNLRSLTLHQTQKEIERTDEYSIFTVRLRPTFDFRQEILSQGCDIEVLEPKWFRDEIAEISKHMWNKYKND